MHLVAPFHHLADRLRRLAAVLGVISVIAVLLGCQSSVGAADAQSAPPPSATTEPLKLSESDTIRVSFPGAPNLDTTVTIRRDGLVALPLIGEVRAAGMTPSELQKQLVDLYATQLVSKEVNVAVVASTFAVYVTGAVLRPGKIESAKPLSVLEAIMEAGGFDLSRANPRNVVVNRYENGGYRNYKVNLKVVLDGKGGEPFMLKPSDTVTVPEKFSWF